MHLIQEIGSYAGIAAIPGLAILSALYFSQARDVRRLRDWAGRAPERSAEAAQGGRVVARPAPQTAAAQTGAQPQTGVATPARPAAPATAGGAAAAAGGGGTATATRPATAAPAGTPPGTHPPVPRVHTGGQTTILGAGAASANGGDPWYRRAADRLPAARYLAIAVVGVLVVGGGIAYGVTQLANDNSSSSTTGQHAASGGSSKQKSSGSSAPSITPKDVSVAILNGTTVNGLASQVGTKLQQQGFQVGNEDNSLQGQVNESVVMFKPGANRKAALVRHRLDIAQTEPADQQSLSQSGGADVIVVLGADKAQTGAP